MKAKLYERTRPDSCHLFNCLDFFLADDGQEVSTRYRSSQFAYCQTQDSSHLRLCQEVRGSTRMKLVIINIFFVKHEAAGLPHPANSKAHDKSCPYSDTLIILLSVSHAPRTCNDRGFDLLLNMTVKEKKVRKATKTAKSKAGKSKAGKPNASQARRKERKADASNHQSQTTWPIIQVLAARRALLLSQLRQKGRSVEEDRRTARGSSRSRNRSKNCH